MSMNNLAVTLGAHGDFEGRATLTKKFLASAAGCWGAEHPDTTNSGRNLFRTLQDLGEHAAAQAVLERDLLWLLDRDLATLGAKQRQIRGYVAQQVEKYG
jgi:hypothetical protein